MPHRLIINDSYPLQTSIATLGTPFALELGYHFSLEVGRPGRTFSITTTLQLGPYQDRVKKCTSGIGIDFDEARPVLAEMEIIAHEDTYWAGV
ncbi:Putative uncharacterized protein [Halomonas sp. R57-5]|nr:Putative uncharacterized protein [Halomonas sp. R57-5]